MKKPLDDNWQSIGNITANLFLDLEEKQRRAFKRECESDGISPAPVQAKLMEAANADA